MTQKLTRREQRMWVARRSMTGPEARAAIRLPGAAVLVAALSCGIAIGVLATVGDDDGWSASSGVLGAEIVLFLCALGLALYLRLRRQRRGLVRVTAAQFDLLLELARVAPVHILEARRLHDNLVEAIADRENRDADVAAIETRMRQLVDGSIPASI